MLKKIALTVITVVGLGFLAAVVNARRTTES